MLSIFIALSISILIFPHFPLCPIVYDCGNIYYWTDVKSPDTLRDQLTLAIRQKDIKSLEKAISETEAARYPELSAELRKARDVFENMGGDRGGQLAFIGCKSVDFFASFSRRSLLIAFLCFPLGKLSVETLRDQLTTAIKEGDRDNLEAVLLECVSAGMPELDTAIQRARSKLLDMEEAPKRGANLQSFRIS